MARFGKVYTDDFQVRHKVVAYSGDGVLQDYKLSLANALTSFVEVGSVVDASGALATDLTAGLGVVVEPGIVGDVILTIADPKFTILKAEALVISDSVSRDDVIAALQKDGQRFASYATFALPTT